MAQQEEPLYDFPEPSQPSKFLGHQRGWGSLKSISVLDRLLLTVPVWLQLSINPATALHILQREPPGTFLVRKSRTSQKNVLCVRLADDSVPSFVQQFGIREEQSTLSLETSAISFPDLPRLISFYCVSRDVLPFPLELPEAIARATSHKELESISHMGIEFWNSHLNVRGPREPPKPQKDEKKPDSAPSVPPPAPPPTDAVPKLKPDQQPNPDSQVTTASGSETVTKKSGSNPTLFHEFCPIKTRSPRELDCGSGLGALCFINPLFLQSLSKRRMFKRSLKVRVSTESSTLLSPPLAPPPPPPLVPKTKRKCKAQKQGPGAAQNPATLNETTQITPTAQDSQPQMPGMCSEDQVQPPPATLPIQFEVQEGQTMAGLMEDEATAQILTVKENLVEDSNYMQPSPVVNSSLCASLSSYLSPSVAPKAPPLSPKMSPSLSLHNSPSASPSLSPYQSPSLSPRLPLSRSPHDSPTASPSLSPYQLPSPSPKVPFLLSPFTSPSFSQLAEEAYHIPVALSRSDLQREQVEDEEEDGEDDEEKYDEARKEMEDEENDLLLQINAASLCDTDSCSSFSSQEEAAETPTQTLDKQDDGTTINDLDCT
ncbi:ras and Rab interactor 1-like [Sphaeramia orbicularis]|uniref:ras and Rab interactor 1-like n=1 Tax=Sphaeramia orbicularis TaxID=375764 RepID=UPI0011812EEE|nr:ras and Rab interactor 1-like [Sphaeramia orbicularis]